MDIKEAGIKGAQEAVVFIRDSDSNKMTTPVAIMRVAEAEETLILVGMQIKARPEVIRVVSVRTPPTVVVAEREISVLIEAGSEDAEATPTDSVQDNADLSKYATMMPEKGSRSRIRLKVLPADTQQE